MHTWVALLRGINVGGKHILPMKELVRDLGSLKLRNVKTYIQSGNVVFQSTRTLSATFADQIAALIEKRHGFKPRVLIIGADDFLSALDANPFPEAESEPKTLNLFFLSSIALEPDIESLNTAKSPTESFKLTDHVLFLHTPSGFGKSKLAEKVERFLGVAATARNWRTVQKLAEMIKAM